MLRTEKRPQPTAGETAAPVQQIDAESEVQEAAPAVRPVLYVLLPPAVLAAGFAAVMILRRKRRPKKR